MTRDDVIKALALVKAAYPAFYAKMTARDAENAIALWVDMFSADDPRVIALALLFKFLRWEPMPQKHFLQTLPPVLCRPHPEELPIYGPHFNLCPGFCEYRCKTAVIRVQMRQKQRTILRIQVQLTQTIQKGISAFLPVEAGVNDQRLFPIHHYVAV